MSTTDQWCVPIHLDEREYHSQVSQKPAPEKVQEHEGRGRDGGVGESVRRGRGERFEPGTGGAGGGVSQGRGGTVDPRAKR